SIETSWAHSRSLSLRRSPMAGSTFPLFLINSQFTACLRRANSRCRFLREGLMMGRGHVIAKDMTGLRTTLQGRVALDQHTREPIVLIADCGLYHRFVQFCPFIRSFAVQTHQPFAFSAAFRLHKTGHAPDPVP